MSDFVVVSKANKNDKDYVSAVVFNNAHKDADNEGEAKAFLAESERERPWLAHSVVSRKDFDDKYATNSSDNASQS
jgi:hypothetical protein